MLSGKAGKGSSELRSGLPRAGGSHAPGLLMPQSRLFRASGFRVPLHIEL